MKTTWRCSGCGTTEGQKDTTVFCATCLATRPHYLTNERYLIALQRFRAAIAKGNTSLTGFDDNTIGDKDTQVTWGLCNSEAAMWPDAQDHIWPHLFTTEGRSAPLHTATGQGCAFDQNRHSADNPPYGCFYRCDFFQTKRNTPLPTRETILARYDELIARVEAQIAQALP